MAQIPAMLFASSGAGVSSHSATNASSSGFDAILASLTPHTQLAHLSAFAPPNEYTSLHDYSARPSPKFENPVPAFGNSGVSLPAPTLPVLKSSVALPVVTTPMMARDYRKPDQDAPKQAAPSRTVTPTPPSATWNAPPQPVMPIRPLAAPAPASSSPVPGIGASDDSADYTAPPAAASLPSANSAPLSPDVEEADMADEGRESTASPTSTPPSKSSDTAHQDAGNVSASQPSAETPRSVTGNPVAQQSPVRIAPGAALPQHVVDAIMAAAAVDSTDLPAAPIPKTFMDRAAQPDSQRQTSDMKVAAPSLQPAVANSDRIAGTSAEANARSRVETTATPTSKSAGSQQPVGQDPNQATSPQPAKTSDVPLKVLEPIVRASGANVTMTYEEARTAPTAIEPDQAVANTQVEEAHSPVRSASAALPADTAAKQTPAVANDPTAGDVTPETRQSPASATPGNGTAKLQGNTTAPELAPAQARQRPTASAPADQIAKTATVADPEIADLDAQTTNVNPATASLSESVDSPEPVNTDSRGTQKPSSAGQSAPAKSADESKPLQTNPVATEVIDPAEMLVSETAQVTAPGDIPAQARGPENKVADNSSVAPKATGSSSASPKPEQQPPTALAAAAPVTKTAGDADNDASANNASTGDVAVQSQTDSAAGKVEAVQAAPGGSAVPAAPTAPANQPGVTLVTGVAQTAVAPAATSAASTTASASAASATAPPAPDIDSLAVAIAANAARGVKHFDIRLDPPELGRVDVHMSVSRDGKAEALLTADRPATLELLQRDSKTLERALKDAGLDLSNNSLNFSLKGQQRQGDGGGASMARMRSLSDAVVARAEAANASTPIWNTASSARLDIRV